MCKNRKSPRFDASKTGKSPKSFVDIRKICYICLKQTDKILLINGARQVGKSYLIRAVGQKLFKNYIEINLKEDSQSAKYFERVRSTADFYLQLGTIAGDQLGSRDNTIVFLDEIQSYPHLMTLLKFLNQEKRFTYIASGSQLGVTLSQTASVPIGSVTIKV